MRYIHKMLFMCMLSSLLFISCSNETVIKNEVENKQSEVAQKEDIGEKKISSEKEMINEKVSDELSYIVNLIEGVHPNPYKYVSKKEILEQGKAVFNQFSIEN